MLKTLLSTKMSHSLALIFCLSGGLACLSCGLAVAQQPYNGPQRTRLVLKDGSYQVVTSYHISGKNVVYTSAERGGSQEEIPSNLIDWEATERYQKDHAPGAAQAAQNKVQLDPELQKEEADLRARTPDVAPNLRLPEDTSVLALDTFHGTPELVPLAQSSGELNKQTAHNILKAAINPLSTSHQVVELKGSRSPIQLHVPDGPLYIRVGDDDTDGPANAFEVNTHGAKQQQVPIGGSDKSTYVIVRCDVRRDVRIVSSFNISMIGTTKRQEDVIPTTVEMLPGGHWMKLTPKEQLDFGEYALLEILNEKEINLGVWDFGVHPNAPENREAIKPQERKKATLGIRKPIE